MSDSIQKHPEVLKHESINNALKQELAKLLTDYDALINVVGPNLEAIYLTKIGELQYELFFIEIEINEFKRRIELYQAAINRGETISKEVVEAVINEEFEKWQIEAHEKYEKI